MGRSFHRLLLLAGQPSEAGGECVGNAKFHLLFRLWSELGNRANHELIEHRYRKRHVSMCRTVDHPLPY